MTAGRLLQMALCVQVCPVDMTQSMRIASRYVSICKRGGCNWASSCRHHCAFVHHLLLFICFEMRLHSLPDLFLLHLHDHSQHVHKHQHWRQLFDSVSGTTTIVHTLWDGQEMACHAFHALTHPFSVICILLVHPVAAD